MVENGQRAGGVSVAGLPDDPGVIGGRAAHPAEHLDGGAGVVVQVLHGVAIAVLWVKAKLNLQNLESRTTETEST